MKILVLGVTGMLGHMAYRVLSENHEVYVTCRHSYDDTFIIHSLVQRQHCFDNVDALKISLLAKGVTKSAATSDYQCDRHS